MKQALSILLLVLFSLGLILNQALPADAAKKPAKKSEKTQKVEEPKKEEAKEEEPQKIGVSQEVITEITNKVNLLTKKIYERELYTPEDANMLIALKLQLDEQMDILPETAFAPIYFKLGNIFRLRGQQQDAIVCYQTILENFSLTAYGPKSKDILESMGVEIRMPFKEQAQEIKENINEETKKEVKEEEI